MNIQSFTHSISAPLQSQTYLKVQSTPFRQNVIPPSNPTGEFDVYKAVIYGSLLPSAPTASYSPQKQIARVNAYASRVVTLVSHLENGSEGERNVRFQQARQFLEPGGYFSGGLLAAGYDPHEKITVTFNTYVGMGKPTNLTNSDTRTYCAWEIAAGALAHDHVQRGGPINFQFMQIEQKDQSRVDDLEKIGHTLQHQWESNIAAPMRDASGALLLRSGRADAYLVKGTLQSLTSDKESFEKLSLDGQEAVKRTLQKNGQVIIPNIYGFPMAGYAFIPYTAYDGDYKNRPNRGMMIDLKNGTVHEINGDEGFASWAKSNREGIARSFNAKDRQGGQDAHWPSAVYVLDTLIAGNRSSYPGYSAFLSDKAVPVRETFNYTASRDSDYRLKYGDLDSSLAARYQEVNANNAAWSDQTEVFGTSQQNWKAVKEMWGNTFGYVPIIGNAGNIVFGVHDSIYGMTAADRVGGNSAAVISGLQLAHEIVPVGVEVGLGGAPLALDSPASHYSWKYNQQTREFELLRVSKTSIATDVTPVSVQETPAPGTHLSFPGMREIEFLGKKFFVADTPDAGDGVHYVLRVTDPHDPEKLASSGIIVKADESGQWRRAGRVGGAPVEHSDDEFELASESLEHVDDEFELASESMPATPYTREELDVMRAESPYLSESNKLGSYNRANNGRYPLRDELGRPIRIKKMNTKSDITTSGTSYSSGTVKPYIKFGGYEEVAGLYEEKLQLRTFNEADVKVPGEKALIGQSMVVANRRIAKGEVIGVYGGTVMSADRIAREGDTFAMVTGFEWDFLKSTTKEISMVGDNIISRMNTSFEYDISGKPVRQASHGYNVEPATFDVDADKVLGASSDGRVTRKPYSINAFFATEDIPAGTELRWNYGYSEDDIKIKFS